MEMEKLQASQETVLSPDSTFTETLEWFYLLYMLATLV